MRRVVLGLAAVALAALLARDVARLAGALAWTASLGAGWGVTVRAPAYHRLPPAIRARVDRHEACHLARGTWRLWLDAAGEEARAVAAEEECP